MPPRVSKRAVQAAAAATETTAFKRVPLMASAGTADTSSGRVARASTLHPGAPSLVAGATAINATPVVPPSD